MARLSKEEHDNILRQLGERTNADAEMMDLIGRLRSDFDESLSIDLGETERQWQERYNAVVAERDRAIGERDESRRVYRERFFGAPENARREAEQIVAEQANDTPKGVNEVLGIEGRL